MNGPERERTASQQKRAAEMLMENKGECATKCMRVLQNAPPQRGCADSCRPEGDADVLKTPPCVSLLISSYVQQSIPGHLLSSRPPSATPPPWRSPQQSSQCTVLMTARNIRVTPALQRDWSMTHRDRMSVDLDLKKPLIQQTTRCNQSEEILKRKICSLGSGLKQTRGPHP